MLEAMEPEFLYKWLVRPLLFRLDAEAAHFLAHKALRRYGVLLPSFSGIFQYKGEDLVSKLARIRVVNPVGLAAGFDKNGDLVDLLDYIGFGFAEIGSVTAQARSGNPKPRLFRLPLDEALINRLGLNGEGADHIAEKLKNKQFTLPIGLNIAKTNDPAIAGDAAIDDMLYTFSKIKDLPFAYVAVNASCPNTEEGILTETNMLSRLFAKMQKANDQKLPILVKLSPDGTRQLTSDIVATATKNGLAGYVLGNTSTSRQGLATPESEIAKIGNGGLSGQPLRQLALELCRLVYELKAPNQFIIGCGGIASGHDAYELIKHGASFVQLYTGLVYEGPTLPRRINYELSQLLQRDGLTLSQAVGIACRQQKTKQGQSEAKKAKR